MRENDELRPLGEGCADRSSLEVRAGEFLHQARPTAGLSESQIFSIASDLSHGRPVRWMRGLAMAFTIVVACLLAGTVTALVGGWRLPFTGRAPAPDEPHASPSQARARARTAPSEPALQPAPIPSPAEGSAEAEADVRAIATTARPATMVRRNSRPEAIAPQPMPAPEESRLSSEARSLADALTRWRRDNQAESALALLTAHDRRFPQGVLAAESRVARAEILLTLGRQDEALIVLDRLTVTGLPRARELQTLRGELRARVGRCSEARRDLSAVMAITAADDLGKRAARAMAKCP